jgi:hypothetical protein
MTLARNLTHLRAGMGRFTLLEVKVAKAKADWGEDRDGFKLEFLFGL